MAVSRTFDDSLPQAVRIARRHFTDTPLGDFRFVRAISGELLLVVPDDVDSRSLEQAAVDLRRELGAYALEPTPILRVGDTLTGDDLLREPPLAVPVEEGLAWLLDRRALGQDWVIHSEAETRHPPRFVFFSLKGGVGRSTALLLWGRHLARAGKRVLLVDLDFEAPGLGSQLLPPELRPDFGTVDWLVEDLVGASSELIASMYVESPIAEAGLLVAPAVGATASSNPGNFVSKLARAYLEAEGDLGSSSYASRLRRMADKLEEQVNPDVVLIDSRSGLHETVAANLLHLDAEPFIFATDLRTTWEGLRYLFSHLQQLAQAEQATGSKAANWRERFKMIHGKAEGGPNPHERFAQHAYQVWTETLYDSVDPATTDSESFSFDLADHAAPHWPIPVYASGLFERFDPLDDIEGVGEPAIREAFLSFFEGAEERLSEVLDGS